MEDRVADLLEAVASGEPAPGGGSVSALAGALGAALGAMVLRITRDKQSGQIPDEELAGLVEEMDCLRLELQDAFAEDAESYRGVLEAFRLPRDDEALRVRRAEAIEAAMKRATEVPLATARLCVRALEVLRQAAEQGYDQAVTDAGVGAAVVYAGLTGSLYNVEVNLPSVRDPEFVAGTRGEVEALRRTGSESFRAVENRLKNALAD
ncbi:MAG: hypothetical protein Kow00129_01320 [Thermoleophilia bacterium]